MGKTRKVLCMRMNKNSAPVWGWTAKEKNGAIERMQCLLEWWQWFSFPSWGQPRWWIVRVGKDWQSCHTPLPAITSPTNSRAFNGGGWIRQGKMGKSKQGGDTWIFSHGSRFDNFPHPYPCENQAPSQFSCPKCSWLSYLIKDAYLHDDKTQYVCRMPWYTIGDNLNPNTA